MFYSLGRGFTYARSLPRPREQREHEKVGRFVCSIVKITKFYHYQRRSTDSFEKLIGCAKVCLLLLLLVVVVVVFIDYAFRVLLGLAGKL